ncbi:MAG: flagellar hook-length control protein FliK [Magnetospiraceae bacterium]
METSSVAAKVNSLVQSAEPNPGRSGSPGDFGAALRAMLSLGAARLDHGLAGGLAIASARADRDVPQRETLSMGPEEGPAPDPADESADLVEDPKTHATCQQAEESADEAAFEPEADGGENATENAAAEDDGAETSSQMTQEDDGAEGAQAGSGDNAADATDTEAEAVEDGVDEGLATSEATAMVAAITTGATQPTDQVAANAAPVAAVVGEHAQNRGAMVKNAVQSAVQAGPREAPTVPVNLVAEAAKSQSAAQANPNGQQMQQALQSGQTGEATVRAPIDPTLAKQAAGIAARAGAENPLNVKVSVRGAPVLAAAPGEAGGATVPQATPSTPSNANGKSQGLSHILGQAAQGAPNGQALNTPAIAGFLPQVAAAQAAQMSGQAQVQAAGSVASSTAAGGSSTVASAAGGEALPGAATSTPAASTASAKSAEPTPQAPSFRETLAARKVMDQVNVRIQRAAAEGAERIKINLRPASLGRVEVHLEVTRSGHMQANIVVDKPETLDLLQRDARGLEQALRDAGLNTDSGSLNFALRDGGNGQGRPENDMASSVPADEDIESVDETIAEPEIYASGDFTGGVDIRA